MTISLSGKYGLTGDDTVVSLDVERNDDGDHRVGIEGMSRDGIPLVDWAGYRGTVATSDAVTAGALMGQLVSFDDGVEDPVQRYFGNVGWTHPGWEGATTTLHLGLWTPVLTPIVVQTAENLNRSDVDAQFAAPVTAGNVMLAAMVGQGVSPSMDPSSQDGGYNPSGWTWIGSLEGDAASEVGALHARIYGKTALGGETKVHRLHDSSAQTMTILEVSGISLGTIADSAQLDNDNQGNPATFDLGTLTGTGWAIVLYTWGRDHGATTVFDTTPGAGWDVISDRGEPIIVTAGQMFVAVKAVTGSTGTAIDVVETGGAGIGTGGGVAILFG